MMETKTCSTTAWMAARYVVICGLIGLGACSSERETPDQLSFVSGPDSGSGDTSGRVNDPPDTTVVEPDAPRGDDADADPGDGQVDPPSDTDTAVGPAPDADPDVAPQPDVAEDTESPEDASVDVEDPPDTEGDVTPEPDAGPEEDVEDPDVAPEPECQTDADCLNQDEDGALEACLTYGCEEGYCVIMPAAAGTPCPQSDEGFHPDCVAGVCDDVGSCTTVFLEEAPCDDEDPCSQGELCDVDGQCSGGLPVICPATSSCELAICDAFLGGCVSFPGVEGVGCEDGDPCTVGSTCQGTECLGGENLCACQTDEDCPDDGDLCNGIPSCLPLLGGGKGCSVPEETVINCPPSDNSCLASLCEPTTGTCYEEALAGTPCDDGVLCTKDDVCDDAGACGGVDLVCDDEDPCTDDACDVLTGVCVFEASSGAACSDGDPCTSGDVCDAGTCAGAPKSCDDGNPCTESHCDAETGACIDTALGGQDCDDGNQCTEGDACSAETGLCEGAAIDCADDNDCTTDSCLPALGCVFTANTIPCDDGDACTGPDACKNGSCKSTALACDDGIPCTIDSCVAGEGCEFVTDDAVCDDGNPCTDDWCDPEAGCRNELNEDVCDDDNACTADDVCKGGACSGIAVDCNDDVPCTEDACDVITGCTNTVQDAACEDDNPCTETFCDPELGCQAPALEQAPCDDQNACTQGDVCQEGVCQPGENTCECQVDADCDDDNLCNGVFACEVQGDGTTACVQTGDPVECLSDPETPCLKSVCNTESGACASLPVDDDTPCPDNDPCTHTEICQQGACNFQPVDCDDGVGCTVDTCNQEEGGCEHLPLDLECSDGVLCTIDTCNPGDGCTYTLSAEDCDDGVACTKDVCDPGEGCKNLINEAFCDDGVACTTEACDPVAGCQVVLEDSNCDDEDPCTTDQCLAEEGCSYSLNSDPCEDGNPCTEGDICQEGACESGAQVLCDDANPCTSGSCDPTSGICKYLVLDDGTSCEDGDLCTNPDVCEGGACVIGPEETCDDGIQCTDDLCNNEDGGCSNTPNADACDDGNPCTEDVCVAGEGCLFQERPNLAACDDGLEGTEIDVCIDATCRGFQTAEVPLANTFFCYVTDARASAVSDLSGNFFAVVNYSRDALLNLPCKGDWSSVVGLKGGFTPTVLGDQSLEGDLLDISHDLAVGPSSDAAASQAAWVVTLINQGSNILPISDLSLTLEAEDFGEASWSASWARNITSSDVQVSVADRYVLAGLEANGNKGLVQVCTRKNNNVTCEHLTSGLSGSAWSKVVPVAVSGVTQPCDGDCITGDPEDIHTPFALVSNDTNGKRSLVYLKDDGKLKRVFVDHEGELTDVLHLGGDIWVSGKGGLVARYVYEDNDWTIFEDTGIDGADVLSITSARGHLFALVDSPEGPLLMAAPLASASDVSWQHINIGAERTAAAVHATEEGLHVVGSQPAGGFGEPDNAALIWYLPF